MRNVIVQDALFPTQARIGPPVAPVRGGNSGLDAALGAPTMPDGSAALRYHFTPAPESFRIDPMSGRRAWRSGGRDRSDFRRNTQSTVAIPMGEKNGRPVVTNAGNLMLRPENFAPWNQSEFSILAVASVNEGTGASASTLWGHGDGGDSSDRLLFIGDSGVYTYAGNVSSLMLVDGSFVDSVLRMWVLTFSVSGGVSIRLNGTEIARNSTRNTPSPKTSLVLMGRQGANPMPLTGMMADAAVYDVDLSRPEYASQLYDIESAMIEWYSLGGS